MPTQTRQLAAIMFTDIVGYTSLMGSDEDHAFEILHKNREIHLKLIKQFNGSLIKEMGDGILISFDLAADAVHCAVEIQKMSKDELDAQVRIGIHLGDITFENEDVFGDGVNLASRLQSIADPGGIYISESLQKSVRSKSDIETNYLGEFKLKNVDYPVRTYAIQGGELPIPSKEKIIELRGKSLKQRIFGSTISYIIFLVILVAGVWGTRSILIKEKPTLLILTPENNTGIDTIPHIISAIHTSLIGDIGKIGKLNIISPYTSKSFKDSGKSLKEIAKETKANYLVQPALSCIGDNVCLSFNMTKIGSNEKQIWSEDFYKEKSQILNLYNTVTKEIAKEIGIILTPEEDRLLSKSRTINREAYDSYVMAYQYTGDYSRESFYKALDYLNSAIEKEPDWAPLYSGRARIWLNLQQIGFEPPSVASPKIYENLNKALELDPDLPEAHGLSGLIAHLMEWDWEKSEREFLKALAINPNDAGARLFYAQLLCVLQRTDEAMTQGRLALDLDPLHPGLKILYGAILWKSDCKMALSIAEEVAAADPRNLLANSLIQIAALQCKEYDKVMKTEKIFLQEDYVKVEDIQEFERIFNEYGIVKAYEKIMPILEEVSENYPISPVDMANRYMIANQPDKAMDWLEKGFVMHDPKMVYIASTIWNFDPLFDNPRFLKIVEEMNLPLP